MDNFKPFPVSSLAALLHWRILSLLRKDSGLINFTTEKILQVYHTENNFIDSHFHLDTLLRRVGSSDSAQYSTCKRVGFSDFCSFSGSSDHMQFMIANFCFPTSWPTSKKREKIREEKRIRLTFGIHPRIVNTESKRTLELWVGELRHLIRSQKVVAIGECGLDTVDRPSSSQYQKQLETFRAQVRIAKDINLPIVIHCRGNEDVTNQCLSTLTDILPKDHPVHRHCFTGNYKEYRRWKKALPACLFGIAPSFLQEHRLPHLQEVLGKINLPDMVLESDAPYFYSSNGTREVPTVVRDIARRVAVTHNCTLEYVAEITSANTRRLYGLN